MSQDKQMNLSPDAEMLQPLSDRESETLIGGAILASAGLSTTLPKNILGSPSLGKILDPGSLAACNKGCNEVCAEGFLGKTLR